MTALTVVAVGAILAHCLHLHLTAREREHAARRADEERQAVALERLALIERIRAPNAPLQRTYESPSVPDPEELEKRRQQLRALAKVGTVAPFRADPEDNADSTAATSEES